MPSTTGSTRSSSAAAGTGSAPGRVDSPPTSTIAAPSEISRRACAMASTWSSNAPPSENESGVTLTTPMIVYIRPSYGRALASQPLRADPSRMEVQAAAAMSILSMTVQGAHDAMERANVKSASADATPAAQADVILELSSAAQALVGSS